jgi:large conductance mechanosensitive channel
MFALPFVGCHLLPAICWVLVPLHLGGIVSDSMLSEFRQWLMETNALALAIGVVIGGAVGKLVGAVVEGLIMPIVGLLIPGGAWRDVRVVLDAEGNALGIGPVLGAMVDFLIISAVVFIVAKKVLGAAPPKK